MSLCEGNRRKVKEKTRGKSRNIEIKDIIVFIKFIISMSSGILFLAVIGLVCSLFDTRAKVMYLFTIIVDIVIILSGIFAVKHLKKK